MVPNFSGGVFFLCRVSFCGSFATLSSKQTTFSAEFSNIPKTMEDSCVPIYFMHILICNISLRSCHVNIFRPKNYSRETFAELSRTTFAGFAWGFDRSSMLSRNVFWQPTSSTRHLARKWWTSRWAAVHPTQKMFRARGSKAARSSCLRAARRTDPALRMQRLPDHWFHAGG